MDVAVGADSYTFSDVEQPAMFCKSLCVSFLGNSSSPVIPTYSTLLGSLTFHGGMGGCRLFFFCMVSSFPCLFLFLFGFFSPESGVCKSYMEGG